MKHSDAHRIATELMERMRPYCERIEIAGSIRRNKPEVKDIELVAVPKWRDVPVPDDLFGGTVPVNALHQWATKESGIRWIKPGTSEIISWPPKPEGKYWRAYLGGEDIKLDLFLATPQNFGLIYLIRTGSAEFSHHVAFYAHATNCRFEDGRLLTGCKLKIESAPKLELVGGEPVDTPEEADVFRILGLAYVAPEHRTGPEAVRRLSDPPKPYQMSMEAA